MTHFGNFQQYIRKVHCVMASLITFTSRTIAENSVKYSKKDFKNLREFEGSIGGTVRLLSKTYNILILTVGSQLISRDQKI